MHSLFRIIKFAFQNFIRNFWLSIVTISILVLALVSVNFIIIFNYIAQTSIDAVQEKIDVNVYFYNGAEQNQIDSFRTFLENLDIVKSVEYISPADALELFKLRHSNETDILSSLDELDKNPLGASLVVRVHNPRDYELLLQILQDERYGDLIANTSFEDYREIISRINTVLTRVQTAGYVVSSIFILISILIVFNTVRVGLYTQRKEIGIMKLVGASNWFVRAPFLFEAVVIGLIALMIAILLVYPLLTIVQPYFATFFGPQFAILEYFNANFWTIFGGQFLALTGLTLISSFFAIGKYMKV